MYLLFKSLLFSKEIILLQSYLQILNFKEFTYSQKKNNQNIKKAIILSHHIKASYFKKIKKLLKSLNINNIPIKCSNEYQVKLIYIILKFRKFFLKNFDLVISGNANSYLDREFINLSNKSIILDDGTNVFDDNFQKLRLDNCKVFSMFESKFFKSYNYLPNKFFFLKKKLKNLSGYSNDTYFLGAPFVEMNNYKKDEYVDLLKSAILRLKLNDKIIYVPHPKENPSYLKKYFKNIKILKINFPIEWYLLNKSKFPKKVIGFRSTALIVLKKISLKFNIINLSEKNNDKTFLFNKNRFKKINLYINNIGIKSKKI